MNVSSALKVGLKIKPCRSCKKCQTKKFQDEKKKRQTCLQTLPRLDLLWPAKPPYIVKTVLQANLKLGQRLLCRKFMALGQYTQMRNQTSCDTCPQGTWQNETGKHWCHGCGQGKYLSDISDDAEKQILRQTANLAWQAKKIFDAGGRHMEYVTVKSSSCTSLGFEPLLTYGGRLVSYYIF